MHRPGLGRPKCVRRVRPLLSQVRAEPRLEQLALPTQAAVRERLESSGQRFSVPAEPSSDGAAVRVTVTKNALHSIREALELLTTPRITVFDYQLNQPLPKTLRGTRVKCGYLQLGERQFQGSRISGPGLELLEPCKSVGASAHRLGE